MDRMGAVRALRRWLANKVAQGVRSTGAGDNLGGFTLKALHLSAPWFLVHNAAIAGRGYALASFALVLAIPCLYYVLGGCILSDAEGILGLGETNVVDPYVRAFGFDVDTGTRVEFTLYGAVLTSSAMLVIMHGRDII
jgi:hypothetical protein